MQRPLPLLKLEGVGPGESEDNGRKVCEAKVHWTRLENSRMFGDLNVMGACIGRSCHSKPYDQCGALKCHYLHVSESIK
eukprot:5549188-Amphidinium_carterae.1